MVNEKKEEEKMRQKGGSIKDVASVNCWRLRELKVQEGGLEEGLLEGGISVK